MKTLSEVINFNIDGMATLSSGICLLPARCQRSQWYCFKSASILHQEKHEDSSYSSYLFSRLSVLRFLNYLPKLQNHK